MPSRLTVVLVSLLLATFVVVFWLWLVIVAAMVAKHCPEKCRCDARGYYVNCSNLALKEIPLIFPTKVRGLLLDNNNITYLENDSFVSRRLVELENFQADFCQLRTIELGAFSGLTKLKGLSIRCNEISEIIPGTFEKLGGLEYLDLDNNRIEYLEADVFSGLNRLKYVCLTNNKLQNLHSDIFLGLPKLETIYLGNNTSLHIPTDSHLINSHSLEHLDVSGCNISSVSFETFANVSALEWLDLSYNNLRSVDINILKALPKLSVLYLHDNPLQCECQLQEVWRWCEDHNIQTAYEGKAPECDTPSDVQGMSWGVLEKGQCSQNNTHYYEDFKNRHHSHTSIKDTEIKKDKYTVTESGIKQDGYVPSSLKQYKVPVYAILFIFGTTGNVILILIIICNKDMRTIPKMYILNLAISDMINLTVHFSEACADIISGTWLDREFMCTFLPFCCRLSIGLAAYSLAVLSVRRYRLTANPFHVLVSSEPTWCSTGATICGVWIVAALFAVPSAHSKYLCRESITLGLVTYYQHVVVFELLVSCLLPLCVIAFSYIMTAYYLVESTSISEWTQSPQIQRRKNTAKIMVGLTLVFLISYLPYHALWTHIITTEEQNISELKMIKIVPQNNYNLGKFISSNDYKLEYSYLISTCLLLLNSCLNPVAQFGMSFAFRSKLKLFLTCCKTNSPPTDLELRRRS